MAGGSGQAGQGMQDIDPEPHVASQCEVEDAAVPDSEGDAEVYQVPTPTRKRRRHLQARSVAALPSGSSAADAVQLFVRSGRRTVSLYITESEPFDCVVGRVAVLLGVSCGRVRLLHGEVVLQGLDAVPRDARGRSLHVQAEVADESDDEMDLVHMWQRCRQDKV